MQPRLTPASYCDLQADQPPPADLPYERDGHLPIERLDIQEFVVAQWHRVLG
jgi:hypothetical protein